MDKAYYQLLRACNEAEGLAIHICRNAAYKAAIKEATDPLIVDAIKEAVRLNALLSEILNRQEYANVKSMGT